MRASSLFVAMLVISSGVAPVWGEANTTSPVPAPPPQANRVTTSSHTISQVKDKEGNGGENAPSVKDLRSFIDEKLSQACSSVFGGGEKGFLQELGLVLCIELTRMVTEQASNAIQGISNQIRSNVAEETKTVSNASTVSAIRNPSSYLSTSNIPNNDTTNTNGNIANIPVASWNPTNRVSLSPPSDIDSGTQVGSRGLLTTDNKIKMERSSYIALLARNEEVHRLAGQMVYQILSKQGQDLSDKQLQAIQEVLQNGQAIRELARGYEKATQQLVMAGVKSIDSLGQQMQAEEGKLSDKTGEIQGKQSTQEVLKAMSELMKDIGLSTQKAIIGTGRGIASSLSGLTKVAGSVEATVASINNTNNILATINENQIKSLELAATAISLQQQQMKMQETELLDKYRNNLTGKSTIPLGAIIGVNNEEDDEESKGELKVPTAPNLSGGEI